MSLKKEDKEGKQEKQESKKHLSFEENEKVQECLLGLKQDILSSVWVDKSEFLVDTNNKTRFRDINVDLLAPLMEHLRREMENRYCIRCECHKGKYSFYSGRPPVLPRYMRESPLPNYRRMTL